MNIVNHSHSHQRLTTSGSRIVIESRRDLQFPRDGIHEAQVPATGSRGILDKPSPITTVYDSPALRGSLAFIFKFNFV